MAARRRSTVRRRRRLKWNWPAASGIALGAVAVVLVVILWALRPPVEPRDPETLCPSAGPGRVTANRETSQQWRDVRPASVTAILVDTTDRVGPISRTDILERLDDFVNSSRTGEMMVAYETAVISEDTGSPLPPLLTVCNPGDPDEASVWTQNPVLVRRQFEEGFRQPLERVFSDLVNLREPAAESPLMENIQAISVTVLAHHAAIDRRLILISDLMQHSGHLSLYRQRLDYDAFDRTVGADAVRTNLRDAAVEILFVQRREHQRFDGARRLVQFWERWVDDQGGRLERISRIDGLN